jgi:tetratricopeptide (TPR) repeat protein
MKAVSVMFLALFVSTAAVAFGQGQSGEEISRRQALQHYRSGQDLMFAERFPEAEKEFSAAIQLDPQLTLAHYGLGQSLMAQKRYAPAVQAFIGCRDAFARLAALRQNDVAASERRIDDEMRELRESVVRVRTGQIKFASEAMALQLEKRLEELELMRKGRGPDRLQTPAEVSLALGSAYYRSGRGQDAEREWVAAVTVNPKLGEAHNNLAVLYLTTGRKKEAEDSIKAAERARFRVNPQLKEDIRRMN